MEVIRRQSIMSAIFQILLTIIGFFTTIYFARTVGADVLGSYFLFMSYFGIINMFTGASIEGSALKRISEGKEQDEYFSAFVVLRSVLFILLIIFLFIFRERFEYINNSEIFFWLLIILTISLVHGIASSGIGGRGKIGVNVVGSFIQTISQNIFQIIAIYIGYKIGGLLFGTAIGILCYTLIQLKFLDLHIVKFNKEHIKSLLSFSFWSILTLGGSMVFIYADTIMIGYYMNNSDVGTYRIIFQFTSILLFATLALSSSLYVKVSFWNETNKKDHIENSFSKSITYSLILAIPLFFGGILLGDKIMFFLYGSEFNNYLTFILLLVVQIVCIFNYFLRLYLTAMNRIKETFKIISISAFMNVVLNALFIPIIGISGAAIATILSILLSSILTRDALLKEIKLKLEYSSLLNIIKSSIFIGIIVGIIRFFIPITNIFSILYIVILCGIVYTIMMLKLDKNIYNEIKGIYKNV